MVRQHGGLGYHVLRVFDPQVNYLFPSYHLKFQSFNLVIPDNFVFDRFGLMNMITAL